MPLTIRLKCPLAGFAADAESVGNVIGLTMMEKLCVALRGGVLLSETLSVKLFVVFACVTSGRNEKLALVLLTCVSVALVGPVSSAKVSGGAGWLVSVAPAEKATVWPTFTVWLAMGSRIGGVLGGMMEFNVRAIMVVWLSKPQVVVMVTFDVPEATVLEAVSISEIAPPVMGFAVNVAVTPLGRLLALNV